jgi:nicotinamidase-related amidase
MSYTLVIVDMQATFNAANSRRVRENCKQEILQAMESNASIIFVEYIGQGPTIPSLVKLTDDYDRVFITRKGDDNGSREVRKTIKNNRLPSRRVRVCGVNTDCCVLETVCGLNRSMKKTTIEISPKACNSFSNFDHKNGLDFMRKLSNVVIKRK